MRNTILTIAALLAVTPAAAQTRIFTETFTTARPGNYGTTGSLGAFTVTAGDADVVGDLDGANFTCPDGAGNNCVDLNGNTPGTISTLVDLIAGDTYRVSFDIAGNGPRSTDYELVAGLGNSPFYDFKAAPLSAFRNVSFDYLATATGRATLVFQSLNLDNPRYWGAILDNVAIDDLTVRAAVPELATWATMIVGLGAIGAVLRRRSSSSPAVHATA